MTDMKKALTAFFKDIDKHDVATAGGKGANLGEMWRNKFPVPNGFAVTTHAYDIFLDENQLAKKIKAILKDVDVSDSKELDSASKMARREIMNSKMPEVVAREIIFSYKKLSGLFKSSLVAVRSSATAEDLPGMSFAGQQATFLNIKGEANLLQSVRECWASLFTSRAMFYRHENKIATEKVKISVIVQKMVQSVVSGVMFTIDPVTNEKDRIVIEAVWGLGEMIVQGSVVPDRYVVQKDTFSILSKEVSDQSVQLIRVGETTKEVEVPKEIRSKAKISEAEVVKLAKIAQRLQQHYYFPQDIEWAKENRDLFITQTRPVTTMAKVALGRTLKLNDKDVRF
ncbi:MAG: PEP/pyruvate-binding domain-containing protein, partial [Patescibacteria group bacterium]